MRGGYPVKVSHRTHCQKVEGYRDPDKMFPVGWKPVESYWIVDAGFIGDCGHKHRSEAAARRCLEPMTKKYRERRWGRRK